MADLSDIIEALEKLLSHPNDTNPAVWSAAWFDATEPGKVRLLLDALKREPVKVSEAMVDAGMAASVGSLGSVETFIWFDKGARIRLAGIDGTDEHAKRAIVRAALEAALSSLEPSSSPPATEAPEGWRDIETAPRDGSLILAANAMTGERYCVAWQPGTGDPDDEINGADHWDNVGSRNALPALYFNARFFTHWQPIPAPPSSPHPGENAP